VSLETCTIPGATPDSPRETSASGARISADQAELGLGIHGEPGVETIPLQPVRALIDLMVDRLLAAMPEGPRRFAVLINNLGGVPPIEMSVIAHDLLASRLAGQIEHVIGPAPLMVIVGENFRFGRGRSGDFGTLRALGSELGFEARAEPLHTDAAGVISSTRIRDLIASGAVDGAERLLGRPHALSGSVQEGDRRARQLGVPSANLGSVPELLPAHGVYAVLVDVLEPEGYTALGRGIANVGVRPTHGAGEVRAEAHVLDFSGDLYGRSIRVHLVTRLRDERRFASLDELKAQLERDKQDGARVLASRTPEPAALGAWH
jgi:riboflavin kinase/FMN adenylyltransferase